MQFLERCKETCREHPRKFIFTEGLDVRVLQAARILADEKLGLPVIMGNPSEIRNLAEEHKIPTQRMRIMLPGRHPDLQAAVRQFWEADRHNGLTIAEVERGMSKALPAGILIAEVNKKDICLAGVQTATAEIIQTALRNNKTRRKKRLISGFVLVFDKSRSQTLMFADCAASPRPNAEELADIAITSAKSYYCLTAEEPQVALLSFSTAGSAVDPLTDKVKKAKDIIRANAPQLLTEGEIQFDAALTPEIGLKKNPQSALKEAANVFIFPSLDAGDIAVNIARHLTNWRVLGPFLQGGMNSLHCLSISAKVEDVVDTAIVGAALNYKL